MRFIIVVPAYNAEKFISRSIGSILNQNFINFEIIIVNDVQQTRLWILLILSKTKEFDVFPKKIVEFLWLEIPE